MRKASLKIGEFVQIPDYEFQPGRSGWNGWLFASAQIVKFCGLNKYGQKVFLLDVCDRRGKYGEHYEKKVCETKIFADHDIVREMQEQVDRCPAENYCNGRYNTAAYWLAGKGLVTGIR